MKRPLIVTLLTAILLSAILFPGSALGDASQVAKLELSAPAQAAVGAPLSIEAQAFDSSGAPVAGVELVFTQAVIFLNTADTAELGRAVTDATGKAGITFVPRSEGAQTLAVRTIETASRTRATTEVTVAAGPAQHESERTGVSIPGVNMWLMAILLGGFWGMFLWATTKLRTIFLQGQKKTSTPRLGQRHV